MSKIQKRRIAAPSSVSAALTGSAYPSIGGQRTQAGKFLAELYESWGKPDWFLSGTSFEGAQAVPDQISVHEYLTMIGNIHECSDDPGYFIDYALAGVPLFRGGIDLGMQSAPNLLAALELISVYANNRPGFHRHVLIDEREQFGLELVPTIDLGPGKPILVGTSLLVFARMATRCLGHPATDAVVEMQHGAPIYADHYGAAIGCEVRYNAKRDAISFPAETAKRPSMTYDADLWRTAGFRCKEEEEARAQAYLAADIRSRSAAFLAENGRPPRLTEMASQFGLSSRTLVRRLRAENLTYHGVMEELLKSKSVELLAQSDLAMSDISERLGFADPSSFYRSFRRWYQVTPAEFRARG